jgi:gamma-glutamyltranspeptidase/glutathione hydrolase
LLFRKVKNRTRNRQWRVRLIALFAIPGLVVSACSGPDVPVGQIGSVKGALGGVTSDEPRATLVAQDILSAGGTAADAAAALYFTLAATYPVAASLGGGGECIVYDVKTNKLENLQFQNKAPKNGGPIAIPGNIRGMAALQARYGRLEWTTIVTPAEQIANFGESLSRAQHMAMLLSDDRFILDYSLNSMFRDKNGEFVAEGTKISNVRLASLLSALRSEGGAAFYSGNWARTFIEDVTNAGGKIDLQDMINYKPVWVDAQTFKVDDNTVGVSADKDGTTYKLLWQRLFEGKGLLGIDVDIPMVDVADATASVFEEVDTSSAPFNSHGTTSFVTSDNQGNAVACVVGLKKPFGTGKMGEITGIVLAPNIPDTEAETLTSPMLVVNLPNKDFYYGSAATGGAAATGASVTTALRIFANDSNLETAMTAPRLFTMGKLLPLLFESAMEEEDINILAQKFPVMVEVDRLAVVNAINCPDGKVANCSSRHDPRGFGLALIAEE